MHRGSMYFGNAVNHIHSQSQKGNIVVMFTSLLIPLEAHPVLHIYSDYEYESNPEGILYHSGAFYMLM